MGRATNCPTIRRKKPLIIAIEKAECIARGILFPSPLPIRDANTTFAPVESPRKRLTSKPITGPTLPTAARASLVSNLPRTATSAALNNCCRIPVARIGSANNTIFFSKGPCSMSTSLLRFFAFTSSIVLSPNTSFCAMMFLSYKFVLYTFRNAEIHPNRQTSYQKTLLILLWQK